MPLAIFFLGARKVPYLLNFARFHLLLVMIKRFFRGYFMILKGELLAWVILFFVAVVLQAAASIF
jgi:hypothetical protein